MEQNGLRAYDRLHETNPCAEAAPSEVSLKYRCPCLNELRGVRHSQK
jgi:hypothetical protein